MKTLIFIVLKIVELVVLVTVYLGLCRFGWWIDSVIGGNGFVWWSPFYALTAVVCIVIPVLLGVVIYFCGRWLINRNLEWSEKIHDKLK